MQISLSTLSESVPGFFRLRKKFHMKYNVSFLLLIATTLAFVAPAQAARYECNSQQTFKWSANGTLVPDSQPSTSLIFDDKKGSIWENGRVAAQRLKVLQQLHNNNALVASLESTTGDYTSNLVLRIQHIRSDQQSQLAYTFYSDGSLQAGQCTIMSSQMEQNN